MDPEANITGIEHEADRLTGFGTRAALMRDLAEPVDPTTPGQTLAIFDLRGYCETFGVSERDSYLRRLAGHLAEALPDARFYRPRKDEFAVLVPTPLAIAEQQLAQAVSAMTTRSGQPHIVIVVGTATLPSEVGDPVVAMRIADSRNYLRARNPRERRLVPRK